jgi:inner membrane transporter RhtA
MPPGRSALLAPRAAAASGFGVPGLVVAGVGMGVSSSVVHCVCDQLAMSRLPRASFALMMALLPATATLIGVVVLGQIPSPRTRPASRR